MGDATQDTPLVGDAAQGTPRVSETDQDSPLAGDNGQGTGLAENSGLAADHLTGVSGLSIPLSGAGRLIRRGTRIASIPERPCVLRSGQERVIGPSGARIRAAGRRTALLNRTGRLPTDLLVRIGGQGATFLPGSDGLGTVLRLGASAPGDSRIAGEGLRDGPDPADGLRDRRNPAEGLHNALRAVAGLRTALIRVTALWTTRIGVAGLGPAWMRVATRIRIARQIGTTEWSGGMRIALCPGDMRVALCPRGVRVPMNARGMRIPALRTAPGGSRGRRSVLRPRETTAVLCGGRPATRVAPTVLTWGRSPSLVLVAVPDLCRSRPIERVVGRRGGE